MDFSSIFHIQICHFVNNFVYCYKFVIVDLCIFNSKIELKQKIV